MLSIFRGTMFSILAGHCCSGSLDAAAAAMFENPVAYGEDRDVLRALNMALCR